MNSNKSKSFAGRPNVVITNREVNTAKKMAEKYRDFPNKQKQVYDKTIGLCLLNSQCLKPNGLQGILGTEFSNPSSRLIKNVADLDIKKGNNYYGTVEVLTLDNNEEKCDVPVELLLEKRNAWIVCSVNQEENRCIFHGFARKIDNDFLFVYQLEPIENLTAWLELVNNPLHHLVALANNIDHFVDDTLAHGWKILKIVEESLIPPQPARVRHLNITNSEAPKVKIGKVIHLGKSNQQLETTLSGVRSPSKEIALDVEVIQNKINENAVSVFIELYPKGQLHLPENISMKILDEDGVFMESEAREESKYLKYKFDADKGDAFSIEIVLGDSKLTTEDFTI